MKENKVAITVSMSTGLWIWLGSFGFGGGPVGDDTGLAVDSVVVFAL